MPTGLISQASFRRPEGRIPGSSEVAARSSRMMSLLIVTSLAMSGLFALAVSRPVQAGVCDQVAGVPTGDWTITTVQVCRDIDYTVDGTININAGGSLTLIDGSLNFAKDAFHTGYALNVNAGGELVLDNSSVTTQRSVIAPYVKLAMTVSGANSRLTMVNGSTLEFPGWFNATGGTLTLTDSRITGFEDGEIASLGIDIDGNNDAPLISWVSSTISMYRSRIERVYESTFGGDVTGNVTLSSSTALYAYDSHIGVDYSDLPGRHNELHVDGTSNAYLYGVTIDRAQDPQASTDWQPAFRPTAAGGSVFLLRWLHVDVRDSTNFPVSGATVASSLSPSAGAAQYPDNGFGTTPTARTIAYLGRTASGPTAWDLTDANGMVVIPLYTDQVTVASLPNAESFGNYQELATFSTSTTSGGADFPPYPAISSGDNNQWLTLRFTDLQVRTGPDLELRQADYSATLSVTLNQPFTVYALIFNSGQTTATNASVAAYLNGDPGSQVGRENGLTIVTFLNRSVSVAGIGLTGTQTLMLVVDPNNLINEGGVAQEANNFVNITLNVLPPPAGFVAILSPASGLTIEPGTALSVTGFVRDVDSNGILGVPLTIELRSGPSVVGSVQTTSGNVGFFLGTINVPGSTADGSYTITVTPTSGLITPDTRTIDVRRNVPFIFQPVPIIGIPYWLFLIILAAVASIGIGVTTYWKFYGLGKMVECGECGAFIPEDATACPKCGVEFEKDMAKCSNCQAWIPVDVKRCPECGVEFATGEVEMADYQEKMRLQYDEVVAKFKDEAQRQLGRSLSDREFQEWWRKQPTFVTFEDWLREEEEMRKMGSKPCPVCGTLNSVTATVCHKCGSLMKELQPPRTGGGSGGAVVAAPPRRSASEPGPSEGSEGVQSSPGGLPATQAAARGTVAIPRRVFQKPSGPPPVVQKRVIKKPLESQDAGTSEASSDSSGEHPQDEF